MNKILKYTLIAAGLVAACWLAIILWLGYAKTAEVYRFDPPENVSGIYLGIDRNDMIFRTDLRWRCVPPELDIQNCDVLSWIDKKVHSKYEKKIGEDANRFIPLEYGNVVLENELVVRIQQEHSLNEHLFNFIGVDGLSTQLGDPDILSRSKSLKSRTYTDLEEGWSFSFIENRLTSFIWGKMSVWDSLKTPFVAPTKPLDSLSNDELLVVALGEERYLGNQYYVSGEKICPGPDCPFFMGEPLLESHKKYLEPSELPAEIALRVNLLSDVSQ